MFEPFEDCLGRTGYITEGWIYLWHKDENCGYDAEQIEEGYNVYVSIYQSVVADGYSGRPGKPEDFREKVYAVYKSYDNKNELRFYIDEDGEEDSCEVVWSEILEVKERVCCKR